MKKKLCLRRTLLLADTLYFDDGDLYADGTEIPTDSRGRVLINMGDPSKYYERIYALKSVIKELPKESRSPHYRITPWYFSFLCFRQT